MLRFVQRSLSRFSLPARSHQGRISNKAVQKFQEHAELAVCTATCMSVICGLWPTFQARHALYPV